jgi:hypothetical protein
MSETALEHVVCEHCGADVREGTSFCYNCGKAVAPEMPPPPAPAANGSVKTASDETKAAMDDLTERLKTSEVTDQNKLAKAARERKHARVRARRNEVVWEASETGVNRIFIVLTLAIALLTLLVVLLAVYWK